jgi:hypothetical protein
MPHRFKKGDYKVRCDISGFLVNASDCRMRWDGLFVRKDQWEPRHPLDRSPPIFPSRSPSNPRPEGTDEFISATDVTASDL